MQPFPVAARWLHHLSCRRWTREREVRCWGNLSAVSKMPWRSSRVQSLNRNVRLNMNALGFSQTSRQENKEWSIWDGIPESMLVHTQLVFTLVIILHCIEVLYGYDILGVGGKSSSVTNSFLLWPGTTVSWFHLRGLLSWWQYIVIGWAWSCSNMLDWILFLAAQYSGTTFLNNLDSHGCKCQYAQSEDWLCT